MLQPGPLEVMRGGWGLGWGAGLATCPLSHPGPACPHQPALALAQVDWGLLVHTGESLQAPVPGYIIKPSWHMRK